MGPDETNELNANRELEEEIGVTRSLDQMKAAYKGEIKFANDYTRVYENVYHVKMTDSDGELKLQESEVAGVEFWDMETVDAHIGAQES